MKGEVTEVIGTSSTTMSDFFEVVRWRKGVRYTVVWPMLR